MNRLKAFWYVYKNSLSNVKYYKDVAETRTNFSLKYFLLLGVFASFITTLAITIPMVPEIRQTANKGLDQVESVFPDELIISSKSGVWQINQPEPYAIKTPQIFAPSKDFKDLQTGFPENLVIFNHTGKINDLEEQNTFMVVNDVNLIALNGQGRIEVYPLGSLPDGEFSKTDFVEFIGQIRELVKYLPAFVILFVLIGTSAYYLLVRLMYLLFIALILLAGGYLIGLKYDYKAYFRIALHTFTLPLTLEVIYIVVGTALSVPFWIFGLNIIFGLAVLYSLKKQ